MTRPSEQHLNDAEIDTAVMAASTDASGQLSPGLSAEVRQHLELCQECGGRVEAHRQVQHEIERLRAWPAPATSDCPQPDWLKVAAGLAPEEETKELIAHAAGCDYCGPHLRNASLVLQEDVRPAEENILSSLDSGTKVWQHRLATKLSRRAQESLVHPKGAGRMRLTLWMRFAFSGAVVAIVIIGTWIAFRAFRVASVDQLLATAYTSQRTLEMRIPGARQSPMRVERSTTSSRLARPPELLEAEAMIARKLAEHPNDPVWLRARGRAELLDGDYAAAIMTLQQALDSQPESSSAMLDLASAYFQRGETESRAVDYATSGDLVGKALAKNPNDAVALFNHAIVSERLFLYAQAIREWERYLQIDAQGPWAEEARARLTAVRQKSNSRQTRSAQPLLTPTEFVAHVRPNEASTWGGIEPRIEDYLAMATADWLPTAFGSHSARSIQAKKAVLALAEVSRVRHGDSWLSDLVSDRGNANFADAVSALAAAIRSNLAGDFQRAAQEAEHAQVLFGPKLHSPGRDRARIEEIYALHLLDKTDDCLAESAELKSSPHLKSYRWIWIEVMLERGVCLNMKGRIGPAMDLFGKAFQASEATQYETLSLRALGFLAFMHREVGDLRHAWDLCSAGLRRFWLGYSPSTSGYNFYSFMDLMADEAEQQFVNVAIDEEALAMLASSPDTLLRAEEHSRLARAALAIGMLPLAATNFRVAAELLASVPQTDIAQSYRIGAEIELARVDGRRGDLAAALAMLQRIKPKIDSIANRYITQSYYQAYGDLQLAVGNLNAAEQAFQSALVMAEFELASITSDRARVNWARYAAQIYYGLVEVKLRQQDPVGALEILEWYRGASLRVKNQHSLVRAGATATKSHFLSRLASLTRGETMLVYALLPHGAFVWVYDENGIAVHALDVNVDTFPGLALHFADLCSTPASPLMFTRAAARRLYDILIAPVRDRLQPGRLLVIESGDTALAHIPFQALIDENGRYLVEKHPTTYVPGIYYLRDVRRNAQNRFAERPLVVGSTSPGMGLPPLPDASLEALDVSERFAESRMFLGADATLEEITKELPRATLFHFSGHAAYGGRLLLMTKQADHSATLDSTHVERLDLSNLRLVVLSACSTEGGGQGTFADAKSLARTFLRAGVPNVVTSRWNVDSASTRVLMRNFYSALLSGQSVGMALATAENQLRQVPATRHPYYWAVFESLGSTTGDTL